ncbi:hypothetical protein F01_450060 [Burkholderia cenocepacia]|nr:hypothetical protein F01_450060 [Burkholderia cenocepacia]
MVCAFVGAARGRRACGDRPCGRCADPRRLPARRAPAAAASPDLRAARARGPRRVAGHHRRANDLACADPVRYAAGRAAGRDRARAGCGHARGQGRAVLLDAAQGARDRFRAARGERLARADRCAVVVARGARDECGADWLRPSGRPGRARDRRARDPHRRRLHPARLRAVAGMGRLGESLDARVVNSGSRTTRRPIDTHERRHGMKKRLARCEPLLRQVAIVATPVTYRSMPMYCRANASVAARSASTTPLTRAARHSRAESAPESPDA